MLDDKTRESIIKNQGLSQMEKDHLLAVLNIPTLAANEWFSEKYWDKDEKKGIKKSTGRKREEDYDYSYEYECEDDLDFEELERLEKDRELEKFCTSQLGRILDACIDKWDSADEDVETVVNRIIKLIEEKG